MKLVRKKRPDWNFKFYEYPPFEPGHLAPGFFHKTKDNLYRVFIDDGRAGQGEYSFPDVWIGRRFFDNDGNRFWHTVEAELRAEKLVFDRGEYVFR